MSKEEVVGTLVLVFLIVLAVVGLLSGPVAQAGHEAQQFIQSVKQSAGSKP